MYSCYGIIFVGKCLRSFNNGFPRNFIIPGFDNSLSSHNDNLKNYFLILGKGNILLVLMEALPQKKNDINFSKAKTKIFFQFAF